MDMRLFRTCKGFFTTEYTEGNEGRVDTDRRHRVFCLLSEVIYSRNEATSAYAVRFTLIQQYPIIK